MIAVGAENLQPVQLLRQGLKIFSPYSQTTNRYSLRRLFTGLEAAAFMA